MFESLIKSQYCYQYLTDQISLDLLLYTHIPTALLALIFSVYVLVRRRDVVSASLFFIVLCFSIWSFLDLNAWLVFLGADNTMFTWSLIDLFGVLMFFFSYRFVYSFIYKTDLPIYQYYVGLLLIAPTAVMIGAGHNLLGYYAPTCEALENSTSTYYLYFAQAVFLGAILWISYARVRVLQDVHERTQILLIASGVSIFLLFFLTASIVVTFLINYTSAANPYNYEIYGLFGMPILLIYLGYLIVRYKAFDIKLAGAQALIATLLGLVASKLFFISSTPDLVVSVATVLLVIIFGYFLVRSVKREIREKERNEVLAKDLAKANVRLRELDKLKSEFVSIASHQLRSPLTAIRGYASMLNEGSFGAIPEKAREPLQRIEESSRFMALSVDDFLNVSRIESGSMKYEKAIFSLSKLASAVADDLRPAATKKGLVLVYRSDSDTDMHVKADEGKIRQVIQNVVDNAMKYTPKGTVSIVAQDDEKTKRARVIVVDTGVGMSEETAATLFGKFVRAKNANSVNVYGTGLGLFIAKQMLEAMGGTLTAKSDGEGKGSTFTIELPLEA